MTTQQFTEAECAALVPGIEFITSGDGTRRAKPRGTRLQVWQLIQIWEAENHDMDVILSEDGWPWLERWQVEAALAYYELFPEEIDQHIASVEEFNARMMAQGPVVFTATGPVPYQRK